MKHYLTAMQKNIYVLIALSLLMIAPVYFFGLRPLLLLSVALVTAFLCEFIIKRRLFRLPATRKYHLSWVITALLITLLMPATIDYYVVALAVFFGLLLGKYILGGAGKSIFNPAAVGVAVVALSYPGQMFAFPTPGQPLPLTAHIPETAGIIVSTSPGYVLGVGGVPPFEVSAIFLGNFPGMMGTTSIGILLAIAVFLCVSKIISLHVIVASLVTVAGYATLLPRAQMSPWQSILFELSAGVLLFGIIFMATNPPTLSRTHTGQVLYGVILALAVMIFRQIGVGSLEVEFLFVLLFVNALASELDHLGEFLLAQTKKLRKKRA